MPGVALPFEYKARVHERSLLGAHRTINSVRANSAVGLQTLEPRSSILLLYDNSILQEFMLNVSKKSPMPIKIFKYENYSAQMLTSLDCREILENYRFSGYYYRKIRREF